MGPLFYSKILPSLTWLICFLLQYEYSQKETIIPVPRSRPAVLIMEWPLLKACKYDPSKPRFWIIQVYNTCIYQRFTFVLFEDVYLPINISVNISGMMRKDVKRLVLHQGAWWKVVKRGHLSPNQELHHLQGHFHLLPGRLNPVYFFNKKRT